MANKLTPENIEASCGENPKPKNIEEWLEYFCSLLIEYFQVYLKRPLKRCDIACNPRSDQKDKWSYHIVLPEQFVSCWKFDMPHVLRGVLKLDKKKWFFGESCSRFRRSSTRWIWIRLYNFWRWNFYHRRLWGRIWYLFWTYHWRRHSFRFFNGNVWCIWNTG